MLQIVRIKVLKQEILRW